MKPSKLRSYWIYKLESKLFVFLMKIKLSWIMIKIQKWNRMRKAKQVDDFVKNNT